MSYKDDQKAAREALKPKVVGSHFGSTRRQRRRRLIDRAFTRQGKQIVLRDTEHPVYVDGKPVFKIIGYRKAHHVFNDYREQRQKHHASWTNHDRMIVRKADREAKRELANADANSLD